MLGTFFSLPDNWFNVMTGYIGSLFSDMSPIIFLVIGILLGVFLIEWLISLIR